MPYRQRVQSTHSKMEVSDEGRGHRRSPLASGYGYKALLLGVGRLVQQKQDPGSQGGQALVETSLILLIFLILVGAIVEFGTIFQSYITVTAAARHGTRIAATGGSDYSIDQGVRRICSGIDASRLMVRISPVQLYRKRGMDVSVEVIYKLPAAIPVIGLTVPNPLVLSSKLYMKVEASP